MKTSRAIALLAACLFACCVLSLRLGRADEPAKADDSSPFEGKYLVVNTVDKRGSYIKDPQIRKLGNREFLVGKIIRLNDKWIAIEGKTFWMSVDSITSIYEFPTADELKATATIMFEMRQQAEQKAKDDSKSDSVK